MKDLVSIVVPVYNVRPYLDRCLNSLTEQTYRMVVEYYVYYYNNLRPHSTLGYKPPLAA